MTIKRNIDGVDFCFELTGDELIQAYFEQQQIYDRQDVEDYFSIYSDEEIFNEYKITPEQLEAKYDDIVSEMRRNMDKYDMSWSDARSEAVRTILIS